MLPDQYRLSALLLLICLFFVFPVHASTLRALQGDVVELSNISDHKPRLHCFGKNWPVQAQDDGRWRGWIGIDLKTKPGTYIVHWYGQDDVKIKLIVVAGTFRISRITVKKKMAEFDAATLKRIRHDQKAILHTYGMKVDADPAVMMHGMPVEGIISTPFGAQRYVNGQPRSPHSGLDIAAPEGTPVLVPLGGKVLLREAMYLNGNTVVIGHGNGLVSVFSHLHKFDVHEGEWVHTGQRIGDIGQTGRATGPHLHWGVRFQKARVNPASLLAMNSQKD